EQPVFARQATGVASKGTICTHQAMAWDHDSDRVKSIRHTHSTIGGRLTQLCRQLTVSENRSWRDRSQRRPHPLLKSSSSSVDWNVVDTVDVARKISPNLTAESLWINRISQLKARIMTP